MSNERPVDYTELLRQWGTKTPSESMTRDLGLGSLRVPPELLLVRLFPFEPEYSHLSLLADEKPLVSFDMAVVSRAVAFGLTVHLLNKDIRMLVKPRERFDRGEWFNGLGGLVTYEL